MNTLIKIEQINIFSNGLYIIYSKTTKRMLISNRACAQGERTGRRQKLLQVEDGLQSRLLGSWWIADRCGVLGCLGLWVPWGSHLGFSVLEWPLPHS